MKHVMKAINDTMSNIKYENKVLRESNQKLYEEVTRLTKENQKLKGEPIRNLNQNKMEKYLLVLWLNEKAIIDGAYYFDTREDALDYYESLPKIARVSESIEITYTICRIVKHELNKSE